MKEELKFNRIVLDEGQFKELKRKLDLIVRLLSLSIVRDKEADEQVLILSSFGFQPKAIAELLGKTPNAVRIALHRARKKSKQPKVKREVRDK